MSNKRYTPLDDPPSASSDDDETEDEQEIITQKSIHQSPPSSSSSSEEEEEDEEEEEEDDEEEEEYEEEQETHKPTKNPQIPNPKSLNSSSTFEFDSDVRSPTASDFAIKPSKKIEKTPSSKRVNSGSDIIIKDKKKVKILNGEIDDEKKVVSSKRVWTIEDELLLLQGFIDYQLKIGCSPLSDMDGFYHFTMNFLPEYATKSQLYEKVRRLKKKFRVFSEKISGVEEPVFNKLHERKVYELSNKIWGVNGCENVSGVGGSNVKGKVKVRVLKAKLKVEVVEKDEEDEKMVKVEDFETLYPYWNAGLMSEVSSGLKFPDGVVKLVKENLGFIGEDKAKEMNEKWEAVFENEAVLRKRRIALLSNIGDVETGDSLGERTR